MTDQKKLNVFICHASEDKPRVWDLYNKLTQLGWIDTWLDEEKLLPGQKWKIEIPKAVRKADAVIVCLSTRSVSKEGYVQREIKYALDIATEKPEGTIFIIPLRLNDCWVPETIREFQWVDYFAQNDTLALERLSKSLLLRAQSLGIPIETVHEKTVDHIPEENAQQTRLEKRPEVFVPEPRATEPGNSAGQAAQKISRIDAEETNAFGFSCYSVGNVFLDDEDVAHVVAKVDQDPLPTDEDAPSYEARCGKWGFGYGMGGISIARFIARSPQETPSGVKRCPVCFGSSQVPHP